MQKNTGTNGKQSVNSSLKKASLVLRAICHPIRKEILELIEANKGIGVKELYKKLKLEQSVCSLHLGILRRAGVIIPNRKGTNIYYSVNGKRIAFIKAIAEKLA